MALKEVKKRNGKKTLFNPVNIRKSLIRANREVPVSEKVSDEEIEDIVRKVQSIKKDIIHIEVIQDFIQKELMRLGHYELAEHYITYRYIHGVNRSLTTTEQSILKLIRGENIDVIEENSNKNAFVNSTQRDLIAGEVSKEISKKFLLPEDIRKANDEQIFHWHDLDYTVQPMFNCFSAETKVQTTNGVKSFEELGKGTTVKVKTHLGNTKDAVVKTYGEQALWKLTFKNVYKNKVAVIHATRTHTWILSDGSTTKTIEEGDTLYGGDWVLEDIIPTERKEIVWCLEVEDDHSFFLENDIPTHNCCLIDIKNVLDNGTVMNGYLIESPRSFRVACTVMTQVIAAVASNQYGGQSVDLRHLGKYVAISREKIAVREREDLENAGIKVNEEQLNKIVENKLSREIADGVQTIQYQLNTLYTSNGQSPFVTLFLFLEEGNEYEKEIYLIIKEVIKQRYEGIKGLDGRYITPSFPKLIYVLDENNYREGTKYWELTKACAKCSIKRSYPDYVSAKKMRELYEGNVFSFMGCRSALAPWKKTKEYVEYVGEPESEIGKYKFEGRFNQGVVSINLPQIAIEADHDMDKFWQLFNERMALCYKALLLRHKLLEGITTDVSPVHWQYGVIARLPKGEKIDFLLHNGYSTLSLGYIGFYEMTQAMLGKSNTTPEGKEFALKVMKAMKAQVASWKEQTGLGFALYGTPAESLCYTFAKHDLDKYGEIKNVTDHGFYTNSYHIFVGEHVNAFDKFKFESEFQHLSLGGSISYVEIPNLEKNVVAIEKLITYMYDTILYAEFNSKSDLCYKCGYDGEIILNADNHWECPNCHNTDMKQMVVVRRTCGYLGLNDWNEGKRKEIGQRVIHL